MSPLAVMAATAPGGAGQPDMLDPKGPASHGIAVVWWILFWIALFVFLAVVTLAVIGVLRGRRAARNGQDGVEVDTTTARPLGTSDDRFIGVGGVAIPLVILIVVGVVTIIATRRIWAASPDAVHIDVQAVQFFWVVHEPDGITTANEIPVPVGQPVEIGLTSRDVIHSFWVPQLAAKVDVIPGQHNVIRFTVSQPGIYRGQCAEYCGIQHANMIFFIDAMTPADYEAWLAHHRRPPPKPNRSGDPAAAAGLAAFENESCAGCHTVAGTTAHGTVGPDLTYLGSRRTIGSGVLNNTPANLARWIRDSQSVKPGNAMPPSEIPTTEINDIVAYLESQK